MAVFATEHTARKAHKCSRCRGRIKPGQRYTAYVVTPNDTEIGNKEWVRGREHLTAHDCYPEDASE